MFLSPLVWIVVFLLIAFFKKSRRFLILSIVAIFFFGNNFIADEVCRAWEIEVSEADLQPHYNYGIVLGGMSDYQPANQRSQFSGSADRLWQSLLLQQKGIIDTIIITGGSGKWDKPEEKEAALLKLYLQELLPDNGKILYESESKSTAENAINTLALYPQIKNKKSLVITSGFHARRAMGCFKKVGLQPDLYTVDMMGGERKYALDHTLIPSPTPIKKWAFIMKEWVGCIAYKIRGWM